MVYASVFMLAIMGVVSLAVDWGRVQTAKTQLQSAVDCAARYAVTGLADGTAVTKAQNAAAENSVDGSTLSLQAADVEQGTWNSTSRTFTVSATNRNAVRITGYRTVSRGNAVPLIFGRAVGRNSVDVRAVAVAAIAPTPVDIVGLNSVAFSGSGKIQRLSGESGTVIVGSNGTYSMTWGQQIAGDVLYRNTPPNVPNGSNCITGTQTAMTTDLAFATPTTPGGCYPVGDASYGGGQTYNVAAGNYSATSITMGGGAIFNITGNVNIYCSGPVDIGNGAVVNTNNGANKLTIYQTAASTINVNIGTVYVRFYAPLSNVSINGSTVLNGSVICKNLSVASTLSYSSALPSPVTPTGGMVVGGTSGITIVK